MGYWFGHGSIRQKVKFYFLPGKGAQLKVEDVKVIFSPIYLGAIQSFPPTVSKSTTKPRAFFEHERIFRACSHLKSGSVPKGRDFDNPRRQPGAWRPSHPG
jgi:hypothetical protein